MTPIGPFWRYYGGKWRASRRYPPPSFDTIVEPFAGAAGYSCHYWRYRVVLVDKSPIIAGIWRYLIAATPREILALPDIPEGGTVDDMNAPQEARWLAGFWCGSASPHPRKRPSPWAKLDRPLMGWKLDVRERIARDIERIRHWQIIEGDYRESPEISATWFIDPPYQEHKDSKAQPDGSVRQRAAGRYYSHQPDSFLDLARWCRARTGQRIVCDQRGADWLPWTTTLTLAGVKRRSHEVAMIEDDNPRQRLLLPPKEKR